MKFALNQMTAPHLQFAGFLDLARDLGCMGVELRNDMGALNRPLFDGLAPEQAGEMVRARGLRFLGLSQVYPFNSWNDDRAAEVVSLIDTAKRAGAETISLIPRNDGTGGAEGERQANLRVALKECYPMLGAADMIALVEPLGFVRSSLRSKTELVEMIAALDMADRVRIVHDTFHHTLAGGGALHAAQTGIVHISAVVDPALPVEQMEDEHRVLIDSRDRLGNIDQIAALLAAGYDGVFSYECFSPETQALADPLTALRQSFDFISARLRAKAA
ncbi:TIM barrel protein [Roseinatronobacter alkalisoli]|uniref:TIM barrel protein n=1 Tax=Roseinatronobacter alkalisoli TaxID=3028235 RepID=A0ABT5T9U3_9RHOB|nr:TIM barrel protein [Roseinatronobacter sp. HJB301]MDD7971890.1 TIM barrel protein [Roseinatronobacter sp. HJB301]